MVSYCSLDEAWGSSSPIAQNNDINKNASDNYSLFGNMDNHHQQNSQNNDNSSGQVNKQHTDIKDLQNSINNHGIKMSNPGSSNVNRINNANISNNKHAINKNMNDHQKRNLVKKGNPLDFNPTMNVNSIDSIIRSLEQRVSALENNMNGGMFKSGNFDYILLIGVGILIIYLLDKFLNKKPLMSF